MQALPPMLGTRLVGKQSSSVNRVWKSTLRLRSTHSAAVILSQQSRRGRSQCVLMRPYPAWVG